ncbi:MAG TPA: type II CAAX endopeptidase family protein [Oligoflexia bacterium]|nr:type II CAAX endopeptidase family protein [Oligoflexia bacterium]
MKKTRSLLFIFTTAVLITAILAEHWAGAGSGLFKKSDLPGSAQSDAKPNYEETVFTLQMKAAVTLWQIFEEQAKLAPQYKKLAAVIKKDMRKSLEMTLGRYAEGQTPRMSVPHLRNELIAANYFNLPAAKETLCRKLSAADQSPDELRLSSLILRICGDISSFSHQGICANSAQMPCPELYSAEEMTLLGERLGWFGPLFLSTVISDETERHKWQQKLAAPAGKAVRKLFAGFWIFSITALLSIVMLLSLLLRLLRGTITFEFSKKGMSARFGLEIFCLYLAVMYFSPRAARYLLELGIKANPLLLSACGILAAALLFFWPLLWGETFSALSQRTGLQFGGIRRFLRDLAAGPYIYLGSLPLLLVVLIIYAAVLTALGIDPSGGAHPIVPLVTSSENRQTVFLVVVLAVIIAPVVEEIMFRGALYSWLREGLRPFPAMLFSSLLFAALHPQGAIGLVPLTFIGLVLAFVREWRGNLTTCIMAHACVNGGTLALVFAFFK